MTVKELYEYVSYYGLDNYEVCIGNVDNELAYYGLYCNRDSNKLIINPELDRIIEDNIRRLGVITH